MEFGITILLIGFIGSMGVLGAMAAILVGGTALWLLGMAVIMVDIHVIEPWQERREAKRKARKKAERQKLIAEAKERKRAARMKQEADKSENVTP